VELRVVAYNVKAFRFGVRPLATLVVELEPDVVLLQECGPRFRLRRFADAIGMEVVSKHFFLRRSIHNAVLARPPWRVLSHRLHRFPKDTAFYPRGALVARLGRAGYRVWAASVHLGLKPAARLRNVDELCSMLLGLEGPVLAGGDLNETPDGRAATWMAERMWDAFGAAGDGPGGTFPAKEPRARIDYLFANAGVEIVRASVRRGEAAAAASDHLPLVVEFRILTEPQAPGTPA
jgi:endonuclease/exonuclease/phosphatase family metal-dependent hydrolase